MSKFYVWIEQPTTQIDTVEEFNSNSERIVGFEAGKKISSKNVNSAIRQANLVAVALMEALNVSDNIDLSSSVTDVKNEILSKLQLKTPLTFTETGGFYSNSYNQLGVVVNHNEAVPSWPTAVGIRKHITGAVGLGYDFTADGYYSMIFGQHIREFGTGNFVTGAGQYVNANYAVVFNRGHYATGQYSFTYGLANINLDRISSVGGTQNKAVSTVADKGVNNVIGRLNLVNESFLTNVSGSTNMIDNDEGSDVSGVRTIANNNVYCDITGFENTIENCKYTTINGSNNFAYNSNGTICSGNKNDIDVDQSNINGRYIYAKGNNLANVYAYGEYLLCQTSGQTVVGKANEIDNDATFIIGCGSASLVQATAEGTITFKGITYNIVDDDEGIYLTKDSGITKHFVVRYTENLFSNKRKLYLAFVELNNEQVPIYTATSITTVRLWDVTRKNSMVVKRNGDVYVNGIKVHD